jgi:hypothetical protein
MMWGIPFAVLQIIISDQPRYEYGDGEAKAKNFESKDELLSFLNKANR